MSDHTIATTNTTTHNETITGTGTDATPFNWRTLLDIHPAAKSFKPLPEAELKELAEDIKANGLRAPIIVWSPSDGSEVPVLLDGVNRLDALALLGLLYETEDHHIGLRTWTGTKWADLSGDSIQLEHVHDGDPYALALSYNVHRRHLTPEQRRERLIKVIAAQPEKSDRQIAGIVKTDHKTVAVARKAGEDVGRIPHVEKRADSKGRKQPARKQARAPKAAPASPKAKMASPKPKRTTALDVLAVWKDLPPEEHRRFFDSIGLRAVLAGIPEAWLPELERWIAANRTAPVAS